MKTKVTLHVTVEIDEPELEKRLLLAAIDDDTKEILRLLEFCARNDWSCELKRIDD
jgi:hypothetical protein